jgi:tetratricopeptide (TPR) repeat protein
MTVMLRTAVLVSALALTRLAPPAALAQERHVHHGSGEVAGLGAVSFANSGNAAAQAPFHRGLALLHSFEYDQAAEAFREAQKADAAFAMAYWGEALTYAHLLWGEDDVAGARGALGRLGATRGERIGKAGTPREKAFGDAIEALFVDADQAARVQGFASATRALAASYPDDLDAVAFAALAAMFGGYQPTSADGSGAKESAIDYAERVFKANPKHPGGAHYLIHACDNPTFAARGLEAARRYAEIAPEAEHALHMPSHIFVQLGLWADSIASNIRSWDASAKEVAARKLTNADLSFHALNYQQYSELQLGKYAASRAAIAKAQKALAGVDLATGAHVDARYAVSELAFQHAANAGDWSMEVCALIGAPKGHVPAGAIGRDIAFRARTRYHSAVASVICGGRDAALAALRAGGAEQKADDPTGRLLPLALRHAELVAYLLGGTPADLEALLADGPMSQSQPPVGPPPTLRTDELLGQARLRAGRARDAVAAFERALQQTPNRSPVLLGLARARSAAGDAAGAADAYRKLLENWRDADRDLPALKEARERVGAR